MSWIPDKPPEQVKADALEMIQRKQREGCLPCAQAYGELALRHGATDDEVESALHPRRYDAGQPA